MTPPLPDAQRAGSEAAPKATRDGSRVTRAHEIGASDVLTPNDRFLLASADPVAPADETPRWIRAPGFSWRRTLEMAASNRVVGTAARLALSEPVAPLLDEAVRARWTGLRDATARRAGSALEELLRIVEALGHRGIAPLLYKGLDFDALCYPTGVRRSFNDVDLVVRPEEVPAAAEALFALGYEQPPGAPSLDYFRRFHLHAILLDRERRRLPCELHWALESPHAGKDDPLPRIFERARPDLRFAGALRPDPIDALILMAGHLAKHLGLSAWLPTREARLAAVIEEDGLVWPLDVVLWMHALGASVDAAGIERRVRELAAEEAIATALRLAVDLAPSRLPAWAAAQGERLPGRTPLVTRIVYPDLRTGTGPTERARRMRAWGFRTLPEVGFAPISALAALLPSPTLPGTSRGGPHARLRHVPRTLGLTLANAIAIARWRLDRWRRERREKRARLAGDVSVHQSSE